MTHDDDVRVADLIGRLGDGDTKGLFRRLLERGMQDLVDAELTAAIGAEPHERTEGRTNQRNGGRQRLLSTPAVTSSCGSRSCGWGRSSRACSNPAAGSTGPCGR